MSAAGDHKTARKREEFRRALVERPDDVLDALHAADYAVSAAHTEDSGADLRDLIAEDLGRAVRRALGRAS